MATPTLVSVISGPLIENVSGVASPYTQAFPEATQSGNLLLAFIFTNSGGTMATNAVTDDQSQTWTRVIDAAGGTNATGFVFKKENTAASVRKVTFAIGVVANFIQIALLEISNVNASSALGLTWSNEDTSGGTAWSSGANQTPTAGSSIYQVAITTGAQPFNATSPATKGGSYQMEIDQMQQGLVGQSWEGVTATSHTPTITVQPSTTWVSLAVEVLAGTGGANANPFRVKRAQSDCWANIGTCGFKYHLPTDGNLILVGASSGDGSQNITSIGALTYTQHTSSPITGPSGGGVVQHFHAANVTPSRTAYSGTVTLAGNNLNGGVVWFLDVVGADPSPLDVATGTTGTQSVAGNLCTLTVSPTAGTRLAVCYVDHASGSETGMSDATINFLIPYANQDGGSTNHYTMDSGFATKVVTAATTFTFTRSATAAGGWEALGAAYKAAAAAATGWGPLLALKNNQLVGP